MAVYERRFRPYAGPRTAAWQRPLVITRYALKEMGRSKLFLVSLVLAYVPFIVDTLLIYLHHNTSAISLLQIDVSQIVAIDGVFFLAAFLVPSQWAALWLAVLVGPPLITRDVSGGALPLYLSRPLSRAGYALGKAGVLFVLLSAVTWVPGLLLWLLQVALVGGEWAADYQRVLWAILGSSLVWIAILTCVSLALSSLVRWVHVARLVMLGLLIMPAPFARVAKEILQLDRDWPTLLSPADLLVRLRAWMLGPTVDRWDYIDLPDVPVAGAWLAWALICGLLLLIFARKIQAYEEVR